MSEAAATAALNAPISVQADEWTPAQGRGDSQ